MAGSDAGFWCINGATAVFWNLCPELAVTLPISRDAIDRCRRFPREVIGGGVRWCLTCHVRYRDLATRMAEWCVPMSHTITMRRVFRYVPEHERWWNRRAKAVGTSWRVTRPAFRVGAGRAIATGPSASREKPWSRSSRPRAESLRPRPFSARRRPRKITLDGHKRRHWSLRRLRWEDCR